MADPTLEALTGAPNSKKKKKKKGEADMDLLESLVADEGEEEEEPINDDDTTPEPAAMPDLEALALPAQVAIEAAEPPAPPPRTDGLGDRDISSMTFDYRKPNAEDDNSDWMKNDAKKKRAAK